MATHERSLETKASAETVWRIWSQPSTWAEWNPDVRAVNLDGPLEPGATGTMTTGRGTHRITIEAVEPGRSFELVAAPMPGHPFAFRCAVVPLDAGGSRISQAITIRGPLAGLLSAMMGKQIAASFGPILSALAAKAESAG